MNDKMLADKAALRSEVERLRIAVEIGVRVLAERDVLKAKLEIEEMAHADAVKAHLFYKGRSEQFQDRAENAEIDVAALKAQVAAKDAALRAIEQIAFSSCLPEQVGKIARAALPQPAPGAETLEQMRDRMGSPLDAAHREGDGGKL